jgi:hypothetical protein
MNLIPNSRAAFGHVVALPTPTANGTCELIHGNASPRDRNPREPRLHQWNVTDPAKAFAEPGEEDPGGSFADIARRGLRYL